MGMADAGNASANLAAARLGSASESIFALVVRLRTSPARCSRAPPSHRQCSARSTCPDGDVITVMAAGTRRRGRPARVRDARRALPISAGLALVGGLAGAAWNADGRDAVVWGGLHGIRPYGVLGAALAMVVAPALGITAAVVGPARRRARVLRASVAAMRQPLDATLWVTSGLVGFADGTNDGQKAMAVVAAVARRPRLRRPPATSRSGCDSTVGFTLAIGTLLGARVLRTREPAPLRDPAARRRRRRRRRRPSSSSRRRWSAPR